MRGHLRQFSTFCLVFGVLLCGTHALAQGLQGVERQTKSVVTIATGERLRGAVLPNKVVAFRGIPYAQAPIGKLRWRPPQQLTTKTSAKSNIRDATRFGAACPQGQGNPDWYRTVARSFGHSGKVIAPLTNISENCLYLNVWTQPSSLADAKNKPVMIWVHGGSNVNGFSHEPNYLGHNFAAAGVVFVSLNYRLGALGFMAHPLLRAEDAEHISGHYGLMDIIAALKWVQTNIARFGGDRNNITLFGESAGGMNIIALMQSKQADGLFHKAIIQSGAAGNADMIDPATAEQYGQDFMDGLGATTLAKMRAVPWQQLVAHRASLNSDYYHANIVDNKFVYHADKYADYRPLMIGSNADEWKMYLGDDVAATYQHALDNFGTQRAQADIYFQQQFKDEKTRADIAISAVEFHCPAISVAKRARQQGQAAYIYLFSRIRPGGEPIGAYHGAEIPYIFNTHDAWLKGDETDTKLTQSMMTYWLNFAVSGNPNLNKQGGQGAEARQQVTWPVFNPMRKDFLALGDTIKAGRNLGTPVCDFLASGRKKP